MAIERWSIRSQVCLFAVLSAMTGCGTGDESSPTASRTGPIQQGTSEITTNHWPRDDRREDIYLGSSKCADCHQEIFDTYFSQHPMGRSIEPLDTNAGDYDFATPAAFTAGARQYNAWLDDDGTLQHSESMQDPAGVIYRQSVAMDFAVGSGERGYSFVFERQGCLYQSSLTWYSQEEKWDLSPGYDPSSHPGFGRRISGDCIYCHAGQANHHSTDVDRFNSPTFLEATIGCERCHGPGDSHYAVQTGNAGKSIKDDIINPARLSPPRRDSVCYQCHLHGSDRILRQGRVSNDYRPGDLISDIWAVFVNTESQESGANQFEAVSQPEQMVSSECFKQSQGQLGCISCHSPHSKPDQATKSTFYRQRCLQCHESRNSDCSMPLPARLRQSPGDSCIQCHMPQTAASDVPHTAQTDHRVLRTYPTTTAAPRGGSGLELFQSDAFPLPRTALLRAMGLHLEKTVNTKSGANEILQLLSSSIRVGKDIPALSAAGWLLLKLGDERGAGELAARVLRQAPGHESALELAVFALEQVGKASESLDSLNELLKKNSWSAALHSQKAQLLQKMNQPEKAIKSMERSLAIDPQQIQLRSQLIDLLNSVDRTADATAQQQLLKRLTKRLKETEGEK